MSIMQCSARRCSLCTKMLPLSLFYVRRDGYTDSRCRPCGAESKRERYEPLGLNLLNMPLTPQRKIVLELASRPQGVAIREAEKATGLKFKASQQLLLRMTIAGMLFNLLGKEKSFRKFATPELAAAFKYERATGTRPSRAKPAELKKKPGPAKGTLKPIKAKPLTIKKPTPKPSAFATAEPIYPLGLKVQVIPHGRDSRYSVTLPPGGGVITQDWLDRRAA